jgi:hypothetical protein
MATVFFLNVYITLTTCFGPYGPSSSGIYISQFKESVILLKLSVVYIKTKLHGLSPRANYTDRACRRSDCQLLRIEGATWSA